MKTATELLTGTVVLTAPIAGRVRLYPPLALCGELEVFYARETIATITNEHRTERIEAPAGGFLLRVDVSDGAEVESDSPLVVLSVTA
jgi:acetyl/propionyl-CoA carboxylase alpha subunit